MAIVIAAVLTAVVRYTEVRTEGPNGRRKLLTEVKVMAGPLEVAAKTMPLEVAAKTMQGRFSQRQALVEFKRNPKGWVVHHEGAARMPIAA